MTRRTLLRNRLIVIVLFSSAAVVSCAAQRASLITIESAPTHPILETRDGNQFLNFEMAVRNRCEETLRIAEIELSIYDSADQLALRRWINTDAFAPSIEVIGKQVLTPGETLDIFNPFSELESSVPAAKLTFSFCFLKESTAKQKEKNFHRLPGDCDLQQQLTVIPRNYEDKTSLILPLRDKIFVWEGHDFYAHHQRVPLSNPKVKSLGIIANSNDFASDFIYLDERGLQYHGDPRVLENWYAYGKPIFAPGEGIVLASANDIAENWFTDATATAIGYPRIPSGKDPKDIGNFVLIDHQNGEYSLLIHMQAGSVWFRPGERVVQGQFLGRIGFSGDSLFPHLHYSLMDGPEVFKAWGLPAYFSHFRRVRGTSLTRVEHGTVDSGDFLESDAEYNDKK